MVRVATYPINCDKQWLISTTSLQPNCSIVRNSRNNLRSLCTDNKNHFITHLLCNSNKMCCHGNWMVKFIIDNVAKDFEVNLKDFSITILKDFCTTIMYSDVTDFRHFLCKCQNLEIWLKIIESMFFFKCSFFTYWIRKMVNLWYLYELMSLKNSLPISG